MISENGLNLVEEISSNKKVQEEEEEGELPLSMDTKTEEEKLVTSSSSSPEQSDTMEQEEQQQINNKKNDLSQSIHDQSFIIEGKRSRKPTIRLEISESAPIKKELSIPEGHGKPLGEIEYINYQITHASTDDLSRMRNICYGRRGNKSTLRKNLREFKGFEFIQHSPEYEKHFSNLIKLKKDQLKSISNILGLPSTGRNTDHAERILTFLIKPTDEGKKLPGKKSITRNKKRKISTNSKESNDNEKKNQVNGQDKNGLDYNYKPGKKNLNKRSSDEENSPNNKRKKDLDDSKPDELPNNTVENMA